MAETEKTKLSVEKKLMVGLVVSILLSTVLIVLASSSKETVFSPYVRDADGDYQYQQLSKMRDTLGESDDGKSGEKYSIYNTMSTPMLVNDWQDPHRTMLIIAAPEKPFDAAEAQASTNSLLKKEARSSLLQIPQTLSASPKNLAFSTSMPPSLMESGITKSPTQQATDWLLKKPDSGRLLQ